MIYELREYEATEHGIEPLCERFRDVVLPLFDRHGLEVVHFWTDLEDPRRILYVLRFNHDEARSAAWAAFQADPEWQRAKERSEAAGPIVASMSSRVLAPVSYCPNTSRRAP